MFISQCVEGDLNQIVSCQNANFQIWQIGVWRTHTPSPLCHFKGRLTISQPVAIAHNKYLSILPSFCLYFLFIHSFFPISFLLFFPFFCFLIYLLMYLFICCSFHFSNWLFFLPSFPLFVNLFILLMYLFICPSYFLPFQFCHSFVSSFQFIFHCLSFLSCFH